MTFSAPFHTIPPIRSHAAFSGGDPQGGDHTAFAHRFARAAPRRASAIALALSACAALCAVLPAPAAAQAFPNHSITLIYPFAPGGIGDGSARIIADGLKKHLNVAVVVENRAGAGGGIGAAAVTQAKPDGYTLLVGGASALVYTPLLDNVTTYDPLKDFRVIGFVDSYDLVMVTGKPTGLTSVKAVIDLAKAQKTPLVFGATGNGTSPNLAAQWLAKVSNVAMEPANYKGTSAAMPDAIAGRFHFIFMSPQSAGQMLKTGQLVGLAFSAPVRDKEFPNIPTFAEAGYPDFNKLDWAQWNGIFAPAAVPRAEMQVLSEGLRKALTDPEIQGRYAKLGTRLYAPMPLDKADEMYRTTHAQWAAVIKDLK